MKRIEGLNELAAQDRGGALAIGNFDGVHLGHAELVGRLVRKAEEVGGPAVVFTFAPHPAAVLRPLSVPPTLMPMTRRCDKLFRLGVDVVVTYPTDRRLLGLTAEQFFDQIVVDGLGAQAVVEGPNFHFGAKRAGDIQLLRELCRKSDIDLEVVSPSLDESGEIISSSRVRAAIEAGDVSEAEQFLGHPYQIEGTVGHGDHRGRSIGFPTANLEQIESLLPAMGVYSAAAHVDGKCWAAAVHLGPNPTFGGSKPKLEVHLLDFSEDIYGRRLAVDFLRRLRDIQAFDSVDKLKSQLKLDVETAAQHYRARGDVA